MTKYLAGHSDVLLGAAVTNDADLAARGSARIDWIRARMPLRAAAREHGAQARCLCSPDYPPALRQLDDPPPVLWMRGDGALLEREALLAAGTGAKPFTGAAGQGG